MASSKKVDAAKQSVNEDLESHRKPTPEEAQALLRGEYRQHFEGIGLQWGVLLGAMPQQLMPQVVATVLKAGGTRPAWRWNVNKTDFVLMAWPKDEPVRACVLSMPSPWPRACPTTPRWPTRTPGKWAWAATWP